MKLIQVLNDRCDDWLALPSGFNGRYCWKYNRNIPHEKPKQVNGQQCFEEALPTHFHVRVDAAQFKNPSFHRGDEVQAGLLPFINFAMYFPSG